MKELDTVRLTEDYAGIKAGTIGVIVYQYDGAVFEVEFFAGNGETIDVVTTPSNLLSLVAVYGE